MKKILLMALLVGFSVSAPVFAQSLQGQWQGKDYKLELWASDIQGVWGDTKISLNFWSTNIEGQIGDSKLFINFWRHDIDGDLPCGKFAIHVNDSETWLDGDICGQNFSMPALFRVKGNDVAFEMAMEILISHFPLTTQGWIRSLLNLNRAKYHWMQSSV